ncbi:hypothetical protein KC331_g2648 [Hortaea werneckii]|nr:hypothetical protein KC331_g2648 [Hortaea werneckii]KAI7719723.1 hypothetical protein KC353_g2761 [Hortaea werneckii]
MPKLQSGPVVQRQTIKQAKAAYKSRAQQPLSDAEKKQLERSIELDRRAWRTKEQERKKAEALKKRQEKERREKDDHERTMLGTQVRRDRFGFRGSQMHLGAFFGGHGGKGQKTETAKRPEKAKEPGCTEQTASDDLDALDDESLLGAMELSPTIARLEASIPPQVSLDETPTARVPQHRKPSSVKSEPVQTIQEDLGDFENELGSSSQIARELNCEGTNVAREPRNASFSSADFDLTAEDLEELEDYSGKLSDETAARNDDMGKQTKRCSPPSSKGFSTHSNATVPHPAAVTKTAINDSKLMPPPPMPPRAIAAQGNMRHQTKPDSTFATPSSKANDRASLSETLPGARSAAAPKDSLPGSLTSKGPEPAKSVPSTKASSTYETASKHKSCSEFTIGELEDFVDDDLILTHPPWMSNPARLSFTHCMFKPKIMLGQQSKRHLRSPVLTYPLRMALPYDDTEYTQVIRLKANTDSETFKAPGYVFVASTRPVAERQYVREMTLARGRLLYEVWDHWNECIFGYICPEQVNAEARRHLLASAPNLWPEESAQTQQRLQRMYDQVKHNYPRAPHVALKGAAETLYLQLYGRAATRIDVERANEEEVKKMVKPRMREVLWSWVEQWTRANEVVALWERDGLLDTRNERAQFIFEASALTWYGGNEMLLNRRSVVHATL